MEKNLLEEMGKRYSRRAPVVIMEWEDGIRGINTLTHLNNLIDDNEIFIELMTPSQVHIPVVSGSWESNKDRHIMARFPLGIALRDDFSLNVLSSGGLRRMYVVNSGKLSCLAMGYPKEEQEAYAKDIIKYCLDEIIVRELPWHKVLLEADLNTSILELPAIEITLEYRFAKTMRVLLDAWSGSILINGEVQNEPFISAEQLCNVMGLK